MPRFVVLTNLDLDLHLHLDLDLPPPSSLPSLHERTLPSPPSCAQRGARPHLLRRPRGWSEGRPAHQRAIRRELVGREALHDPQLPQLSEDLTHRPAARAAGDVRAAR